MFTINKAGWVTLAATLLVSLLSTAGAHGAQTVHVDLDRNGTTESDCVTDIVSNGPTVDITNTVTNRSLDAFYFYWPSSGPGGFTSSVPFPSPPVSTEKGTRWHWTTSGSLLGFIGTTCLTDICLQQTSGPDNLPATCSDACLDGVNINIIDKIRFSPQMTLNWLGAHPDDTVYRSTNPAVITAPAQALLGPVSGSYTDSDTPEDGKVFYYRVRGTGCNGPANCRQGDCGLATEGFCSSVGPFGVVGRSKTGTFPVTLSEATLASSLITFFSPGTEIFKATNTGHAGGVTDSFTNSGTSDVTVTTPAVPSGCCGDSGDPHQIRCDDVCVHYLSDRHNCGACGNACDSESICSNGSCVVPCGELETFCSGLCVTLSNDNANCGTCGHACGSGECCSDGVCTPPCAEGRDYCGGECVDTSSDDINCGSCGNSCGDNSCCDGDGGCTAYVCNPGETSCAAGCTDINTDPNNCGGCGVVCPYCCGEGSCNFECGPQSSPHPAHCPNLDPILPEPAQCYPDALAGGHPSAHVFPIPPPTAGEAPACLIPEFTKLIHPGESFTSCRPGGPLFKEVSGSILVCGDAVPGVLGVCSIGTTGTFNRLVADSTPVGDAFVTPFAIHVLSDTSNDGMLQPGEQGTLGIEVLNAGPVDITHATATLSGPVVDLTDDQIPNPVGITVGGGQVDYGTIQGRSVATDCADLVRHPASNMTVFPVTVPADHPPDSIRPMILSVAGSVNGSPFTEDVSLSLGIGSKCDASAHTREFDGVDGLNNPMAKLVPAGDPVQFPSNSFSAGSTRPLRLRMSCGGVNLSDAGIDPPQIVGISEATRGPLDIGLLNLNSDNSSNPDDPFFRFNNTIIVGGQWTYNMRTSLLGTGTFTLTIRIGKRKDYVTGFKLR